MARGMRGGMNPRMMKQLQKQMNTEELDAVEVIMKFPDRTLIFKNPSVTAMDVMGQKTYQIMGAAEEAATSGEGETTIIPKEDILLVAERAGVSESEAREALKKNEGDIADAIIELMG